jgi:hypothetical protein
MPVQTIDWYRGGAAGANGAGSAADGTNGEVGYYYALGYPAGSELGLGSSQLPETSSSSRRNSLESYQVRKITDQHKKIKLETF